MFWPGIIVFGFLLSINLQMTQESNFDEWKLWTYRMYQCPQPGVQRKEFPFDPEKYIQFFLYTSHDNVTYKDRLVSRDASTLDKSQFYYNTEVKIVIHDVLQSHETQVIQDLKDEYIKGRMNVILVNWYYVSLISFIETILDLNVIGGYIAKFIDYLVQSSTVPLWRVHVIGHGLGAHIAFSAANILNSTSLEPIARITALDPFGPCFENEIFPEKLHRILPRNIVAFIDVIHTNIWLLGYKPPIGDQDFYPNEGMMMPGCINAVDIYDPHAMFCSHDRAVKYFTESIHNLLAFPTHWCTMARLYNEECQDSTLKTPVNMGQCTSESCHLRGKFYTQTNSIRPYSMMVW